jgi:hypothetical protein
LGWSLCGSARAILQVATRRAYFWSVAGSSLAGHVFVYAHDWPGATWAKCSLALLGQWGILDWPLWITSSQSSLSAYSRYVKHALEEKCVIAWRTEAAKHVYPFSYLALSDQPQPGILDACRLQLPWPTLVGHRELSRLRCGLLRLGHVARKRSQASVQYCIFCNRRFRNVYKHVVCDCPVQAASRLLIQKAGVDCSTCVFLAIAPSSSAFGSVVGFAVAVGSGERSFWTAGSG